MKRRRFDLTSLPRCGALARSTGQPCQRYGNLKNGRCKLHGGRSTGAKTAEGKRKSARAGWKHGRETAGAQQVRRKLGAIMKLIKLFHDNYSPGYFPAPLRDRERFLRLLEAAGAPKPRDLE